MPDQKKGEDEASEDHAGPDQPFLVHAVALGHPDEEHHHQEEVEDG